MLERDQVRSYQASPGTPAAPPPPRSSAFTSLAEQEQLLGAAHSIVNDLETALQPILAQIPESTGGNGKIHAADPVGLVRRIDGHNSALQFLIERVRSIGERLEL